MLEKKISLVNVGLTIIIFVSIFIIGFQAMKIKRMKFGGVAFAPGEILPQLDLLSLDNTPVTTKSLSQGVTVLFVFKTPCSACNSNLSPWNNIAKFFGNRINALGIIPDGNQAAFTLMSENKVNFSLYIPENKIALRDKMRLRLNTAQTIILYKNKVIALRLGDLSQADLQFLVATIKKAL